MIMRTIGKEVLTVSCVVALAASVAAQPPSPSGSRPQNDNHREAKVTAERRMYEDIEVMRLILLGGLRRFAAPTHQSAPMFSSQGGKKSMMPGTMSAFHSFENAHQSMSNDVSLEGTYLKGYGVIFSASLPAHFPGSVTLSAKSEPKPLSQWERVQKELRGEKLKETEKSPHRNSEGFAGQLLRLLADNGYHFEHLADDEQLTVSVTFRSLDTASCVQCHTMTADLLAPDRNWMEPRAGLEALLGKSPASMGGNPPGLMGKFSVKSGSSNSRAVPDASQSQNPSALNSVAQSILTEWENQVLLGDLNAKQGRSREAESAYRKAAEQFVQRIRENDAALQQRGIENTDPSDYLVAVQLLSKVAQTAQAGSDARAASDALAEMSKCLRELEKITQRQQRQVGAAPIQPTPIPTKVIISVSKKLLTEVGTGKMSFDDFNKSVVVHYVRYPNSEESSGSSTDPNAVKP